MRRVPFLLVGIAIASVTLVAQTPAYPSFEVVSIKPNPGANFATFSFQGGRLVMVNQPVASLITFAYPTDVLELVGAPAWGREPRASGGTARVARESTRSAPGEP